MIGRFYPEQREKVRENRAQEVVQALLRALVCPLGSAVVPALCSALVRPLVGGLCGACCSLLF